MERWIPTPVDKVGMPLPLRPPEEAINFRRTDLYDRNHCFHPSTSPDLKDDLAGEALRNSRIQWCDYDEHHSGYHNNYSGPPLPDSEAGKFGLVVMAAALYIPERAIDCRNIRRPQIVQLPREERRRLWSTGEISVAGRAKVKAFITDYVLRQDLSHVGEQTIDEFLETKDHDRRRSLGNYLIKQAAHVATEPISRPYQLARRTGRIPRVQPAGPHLKVRQQLGNPQERDRLLGQLRQRLAA